MTKRRKALLFCAGAVFSCANHGGGAADATRPPEDASPSASASTAGRDDAGSATPSWVSLVREERWTAAAAAIDALPDADRKKPEVRFARARIAIEKRDGKTATGELAGLEAELPALAPEIGRARARAQAIDGPFADAGEWFAKHAAGNDDHVAAADAFMKAKLPSRANAECAHVISAEHKTRAQEAAARSIRLHTGETADAIADARWLLVHGVLS